MRRVVAWIARFASWLLFRRVEVAGLERYPKDRPVLLVANHFNGFVDPVLIATAMRTAAPLHRQGRPAQDPRRRASCSAARASCSCTDGSTRTEAGSNEDAFVECHRALAERDVVAIFPEGTTHDRAQIDPIKTGAARIALGARAAGATDLAIVPVGLTFPDKVALRSSALVQFGLPIELDVVAPDGVGPTTPRRCGELTAVIDRGIRAVSPDFPDVETALALDQAAQIALSSPARPRPVARSAADLARRLGRADAGRAGRGPSGRRPLPHHPRRAAPHRRRRDPPDQPRPGCCARRSGSRCWSSCSAGSSPPRCSINVWPAALVVLVSLLVKTPVSKGTARVLVGLVAFPAAWITAGVLAADGASG